jgi:hypothetical protein
VNGTQKVITNVPQFYSVLFYSVLFYSVLFYSVLFYSVLFYSVLFYSVLFYSVHVEPVETIFTANIPGQFWRQRS